MRRYLRFFLGPVIVIAGVAAVLSTWFQPLSGDLTRIGFFSERDFGWNSPQPLVKVLANDSKSVPNPDVLVLGDSFSEDNIWQSALAARTGQHILTYDYTEIACRRSWLDYALARPGVKTVIVESVERIFVGRYAKMGSCEDAQPPAHRVAAYQTPVMRATWPPALHLSYTFHTVLNTWKMRHTPGQFRSGKVINTPLKPGCAAFSNGRADRLLYYARDNLKLKMKPNDLADAVANIRKIQDEFTARGKKFIFILVPDKSSAYRDCLADDPEHAARLSSDATGALRAAGVNTPDLLTLYQHNANHIVDLYLPDDTHFSRSGYLLMASQIAPLLPPARTAFAAR